MLGRASQIVSVDEVGEGARKSDARDARVAGDGYILIKLAQTLMSGLGLGVGDLRLTQDLIGQCQPSEFICRRHQDGSQAGW